MTVSVLIPTFRRPESFRRAVLSVLAQRGVENIELIAIDNSPEGSALALCAEFAQCAPIPFRYAHEARPGVAHARNAALALALGELVAWLDDDEEAASGWLAALVTARAQTGAQSVFGPVTALAPDGGRWRAFLENLYARRGPSDNCSLDRAFGIGNSLQPRALFSADEFDTRANQTGGEDDRLFSAWSRAGAHFAWAADAAVIEHVEGARAHIGHGLKRAFAYGQGPCETAWTERRYASLARYMCVGAVQFCVFGAGAMGLALARNDRAPIYLDRAARGAGKILWFFEQCFYGAHLARAA